eukprot:COSAG04_NODE_2783_length_3590_cov_40.765397_6_plen_186_part_00
MEHRWDRAATRWVRARPAVAERIGARNGTGGAVLREIMRLDTHFWARRVWVDFRKPSCYSTSGGGWKGLITELTQREGKLRGKTAQRSHTRSSDPPRTHPAASSRKREPHTLSATSSPRRPAQAAAGQRAIGLRAAAPCACVCAEPPRPPAAWAGRASRRPVEPERERAIYYQVEQKGFGALFIL